jgi:hypothetical protein
MRKGHANKMLAVLKGQTFIDFATSVILLTSAAAMAYFSTEIKEVITEFIKTHSVEECNKSLVLCGYCFFWAAVGGSALLLGYMGFGSMFQFFKNLKTKAARRDSSCKSK